MPTIDLTHAPPPPEHFLAGLPRRVALTRAELEHAATLAGGAPLPFDVADHRSPDSHSSDHGLADRLGQPLGSPEDTAYAAALEALHDAAGSLTRRGLLDPDGTLDAGLAGALGLLATPRLALEVDVASAGMQAKAWHREDAGAVATLATVDGVVFELAWFGVDQWADELSRVPTVPDEIDLTSSALPASVRMPLGLADAAGEALRSGRHDLVPVLVAQQGAVLDEDDEPMTDAASTAALTALHTEARGRLRVLAAEVDESGTETVGVVSWVLLADGWHALTPERDGSRLVLRVRHVEPGDLAGDLAPVLSEVRE